VCVCDFLSVYENNITKCKFRTSHFVNITYIILILRPSIEIDFLISKGERSPCGAGSLPSGASPGGG
jgi:hypothetical protein